MYCASTLELSIQCACVDEVGRLHVIHTRRFYLIYYFKKRQKNVGQLINSCAHRTPPGNKKVKVLTQCPLQK